MTDTFASLIVLDLDGTVLHEDGTISPAVSSAVSSAVHRGHEVMVATGRGWGHTKPIIDLLGIQPRYVVSANGAKTMRLLPDGTYEHFHVETFDPRPALERIKSHLADGRFMVELVSGRRLFTSNLEDWNEGDSAQVEFEQLWEQPVTRIVVVSPEHSEEEFFQIVEHIGLHQVAYSIGWTSWLDIAPDGVNKAVALERVRTQADMQYPMSKIVAVGDGSNDVEMLTWAALEGRGVAMGQASRAVVQSANEQTGSLIEDGVATLLNSID